MVHIFSRSVESSGDELFALLNEILTNQRKIMGDFTTLNTALASLNAAVSANTAAVSGVTTFVGTLSVAPDQSQINAAAAQVSAAVGQVQTNTSALGTLMTPPVTAASTVPPAPAPVVTHSS